MTNGIYIYYGYKLTKNQIIKSFVKNNKELTDYVCSTDEYEGYLSDLEPDDRKRIKKNPDPCESFDDICFSIEEYLNGYFFSTSLGSSKELPERSSPARGTNDNKCNIHAVCDHESDDLPKSWIIGIKICLLNTVDYEVSPIDMYVITKKDISRLKKIKEKFNIKSDSLNYYPIYTFLAP